MEYVPGVPITEFCDQHQLTTRERLELFIPGLRRGAARASEGHHPPRPQALEHAGRRCTTVSPVPKVIDFGVAKATGRSSPSRRCSPSWRSGRHAGIHEPRAGGDDRAGCRHADRHLLVSASCCTSCLSASTAASIAVAARAGGSRRLLRTHSRGRAARAQHASYSITRTASRSAVCDTRNSIPRG